MARTAWSRWSGRFSPQAVTRGPARSWSTMVGLLARNVLVRIVRGDRTGRYAGAPRPRPVHARVVAHVQRDRAAVAQATRRRDLGSKLEDYLRDGLRELWIVDLVEQCALVYRDGHLVARHARGTGAR